uniref:Perilipin 2 n=1 Tax=Macaca mulatta TaxID=9544 RepID=F6RRL8_MACMU
MASVAVDPQPSVVTRVINLPLVSSTYDLMSSAYLSTKDQYPYLKSVCEMAEKGVKTITSVAMTSALPIIQKLEPQIAVANIYACKGLDRIEERLPILNQPSTQKKKQKKLKDLMWFRSQVIMLDWDPYLPSFAPVPTSRLSAGLKKLSKKAKRPFLSSILLFTW